MERLVLLNKKGVTLIELMVSLVILLVVSLAFMQTALLGTSTNVANQIRDEAVTVAEMRMNQLRSLPFTDTTTNPYLVAPGNNPVEVVVQRKFRGFSVNYTPTRTITNISTDAKQITVTVSWSYRGKTYSHGIMTIMRKQQ